MRTLVGNSLELSVILGRYLVNNLKLRSADGASLLCGFAVFVPMLGVRGALFSLFPGLAFRNKRLLIAGAVYGFILDLGFAILWAMLGWVWEPRTEYNRVISHYLPPDHMVVTHCGCIVPNVIQVVGGLTLWAGSFYFLWTLLWPREIVWKRRVTLAMIGASLMGAAGLVVWIFAPLNEWSFRFPPSERVLDPESFLILFVSIFPLCSLITGLLISYSTKQTMVDQTLLAEMELQLAEDLLYFGWLMQMARTLRPGLTDAEARNSVLEAVLHLHKCGRIVVGSAEESNGMVVIQPWLETGPELKAKMESAIIQASEMDCDFCFWIEFADQNASS